MILYLMVCIPLWFASLRDHG